MQGVPVLQFLAPACGSPPRAVAFYRSSAGGPHVEVGAMGREPLLPPGADALAVLAQPVAAKAACEFLAGGNQAAPEPRAQLLQPALGDRAVLDAVGAVGVIQ